MGTFVSAAIILALLVTSSSCRAAVIKTERWCDNPIVDATYYSNGTIYLDVPDRGTSDRTMQFIPTPAPTNPEPTPTPTDTTRGYVVFVPLGREGVLPDYRPATSEITGSASIFASPGEYEQATFAIRPIRDLGNVTFSCGDFTGTGGAVIPSSNVDIYIVEPTLEQLDNESGKSKCKWVAKWLRPVNTNAGTLGKNVQVYVDVHVPEGATAGMYAGSVAIQIGGVTTSSSTINLEVLPLTLSRPMPWGFFDYYWVQPGQNTSQVEFELAEMRRLGATRCVISLGYGNTPDVRADGSVDLSFYDFCVQLYKQAGFQDPPAVSMEGLMWSIFSAKGVLAQYPFTGTCGDPLFSASSVDAATRAFAGLVMQNIYSHAQAAGWGDFYAYYSDEPHPGGTQEKGVFMCGVTREYVPAMRTAETLYLTDWWTPFSGLVTLNACHYIRPLSNATENTSWRNFANSMGTPEFYGMDFPGTYDGFWQGRVTTFMHEKGGMDGIMNWIQWVSWDLSTSTYPWSAYIFLPNTWKLSPWTMPDSGTVWRSLVNIGEREGVDDSRYVRTLKAAIEDADANGLPDLAASGRTVLQGVLDEVHWNSDARPAVWDGAHADAARRRLADSAVLLTTGRPRIYVDQRAAGPAHNGQSWGTAYLTVQQAIDAATTNVEVWVAEGAYPENITMRQGVSLYGGFAGDETNRASRNYRYNSTILDGGAVGRVVSFPSGVAAAIDGFTIRNGSAYSGAGVYCFSSSPTIRNNIIIGNIATGPGGGVYAYYGSPNVTNNIIAGNSALYGGGAYFYNSSSEVTSNTIASNSATFAGNVYCELSPLTFANNIVAFGSSGIYNVSGSPTLKNNCVYGNSLYNYNGLVAGAGDISVDPLLVNTSGGNYHILPTSPCMNSGDDPSSAQTFDVDNEPRVYGGRVDIGADEVQNAGVIYVNKNAAGSVHNGQSWDTAYLTVQEGINTAIAGKEVWVAAATYNELITLKTGVEVYGGFVGTETERGQRDFKSNVTILDGGAAGRVVSAPSGVTNTAAVDGFTIRNGRAASGAGIYCFTSSPTIRNNVITGNVGTTPGGGIYCYYGSPSISNNIVAGNSAVYGGGIYCYNSASSIVNNTLVANTATYGGGLYCELSALTFANNIVAFGSSGIRKASGTPTLKNNCVYGNTVYNYNGISAGTGDISVDPLFVDMAGNDYHLQRSSPCVEAGDSAYVQTGWVDIDDQSRIYGTKVDIGADEVHGTISLVLTLGDYSGDATTVPVTIDLTARDGRHTIAVLRPGTGGSLLLPDVDAGSYDLIISGNHWLRKIVRNVRVQ